MQKLYSFIFLQRTYEDGPVFGHRGNSFQSEYSQRNHTEVFLLTV